MHLNDVLFTICVLLILAFFGMIIYAKFFIPPIYVMI